MRRKLERPGLALDKRARRKINPRVGHVAAPDSPDERKTLMAASVAKGFHGCFVSKQDVANYTAMGYKPVVVNGEEVQHLGDKLMAIEEAKFLERRNSSEMVSVDMLSQALKGKGGGDAVRDGEGRVHRLVETPED